jgi:hypothetical protein
MSDKDKKEENKFFSPKGGSKPEQPNKEKPFAGKLNDPNVPMRRKNRVLNDGKDWFDTHPDA